MVKGFRSQLDETRASGTMPEAGVGSRDSSSPRLESKNTGSRILGEFSGVELKGYRRHCPVFGFRLVRGLSVKRSGWTVSGLYVRFWG